MGIWTGLGDALMTPPDGWREIIQAKGRCQIFSDLCGSFPPAGGAKCALGQTARGIPCKR